LVFFLIYDIYIFNYFFFFIMEFKKFKSKEKIIENDNNDFYKTLFIKIQNQIKDYVINKLISKVCYQNKLIKELNEENDKIKKNFLFLLKKVLLNEKIIKNNSISIIKPILNSPIKVFETKNSHSHFDSDNIYQNSKNSNLDINISKTYNNIINKRKNKVSFINNKNIPLNEDIFIHRFNHLKSKSYFNDNQISTTLISNQSQGLLNTYDMMKKTTSERNNNKFNKMTLKINSNLTTPKTKKKFYKFNYSCKSIHNTEHKEKNNLKLNLEEQKNFDKGDYQIKIRKNTNSHKIGLLSNKI